jgi:hypothetical protein
VSFHSPSYSQKGHKKTAFPAEVFCQKDRS